MTCINRLPRQAAALLFPAIMQSADAAADASTDSAAAKPLHPCYFCLPIAQPRFGTHTPQAAHNSTWLPIRLSNCYCESAALGQTGQATCEAAHALCQSLDSRLRVGETTTDDASSGKPVANKIEDCKRFCLAANEQRRKFSSKSCSLASSRADLTGAGRSIQTAHQHVQLQPQQGTRYTAFVRLSHRTVALAAGP